jgi:hypothetical protein
MEMYYVREYTPLHIHSAGELCPFIYYSGIGDPFIYWRTKVHFWLTEYIKWGIQGIIAYIHNLIQNITAHGLLRFFCTMNAILMKCLKI